MTYPETNLEQLRDLTLRLADTEESLLKANAFLAAIVESAQEAIVGKDINGFIQSWNPAAERIYGYTADEMIGHSMVKIIPEDRRSEFEDVLARIAEGEKVGPIYTTRIRKDGTVICLMVTYSPIRARSGAVIGLSSLAYPHPENLRMIAHE